MVTISPQRFRIVQGMTRPTIVATLNRVGGVIDLSDKTVWLWMGDEYTLLVDGQSMFIMDPDAGKVGYAFTSDEVSQVGRWMMQVEVLSSDGRTERNYRAIDVVIARGPVS